MLLRVSVLSTLCFQSGQVCQQFLVEQTKPPRYLIPHVLYRLVCERERVQHYVDDVLDLFIHDCPRNLAVSIEGDQVRGQVLQHDRNIVPLLRFKFPQKAIDLISFPQVFKEQSVCYMILQIDKLLK